MIADFRLQIGELRAANLESETGQGQEAVVNREDMKKRTKEFAKRVVGLCRTLPTTREARLVGDQLFRAGTSVGSNYRAACRARSTAEFIAKLGIVLEEADESLFWLELLAECEIVPADVLAPFLHEANELVAIFVSSLNTAKRSNT